MTPKSEAPGPKQLGAGRPSETGVTVSRQGDHDGAESSSYSAEACESHESHDPGGPPIRQTARFGGAAGRYLHTDARRTQADASLAASAELASAELDKLRRIEAWAWKRHPFEVQSLLGNCDSSPATSNPWLLVDAFAWLVRVASSDPLAKSAVEIYAQLSDADAGVAAAQIVDLYKRSRCAP